MREADMEEHSEKRDKDIKVIDIQMHHPCSLEALEKEIAAKLRSQHVVDLLCKPGHEVVIRMLSEGN
jgi:hypothetical protein